MRILAIIWAILLAVALASDCLAATANLSIVINSPPSTAVNCTINYPSGQTAFLTPVAKGSLVATCTVTPTGWSGALTLGGADGGSGGPFALSGLNVVVGAADVTAPKTYNITLTATP